MCGARVHRRYASRVFTRIRVHTHTWPRRTAPCRAVVVIVAFPLPVRSHVGGRPPLVLKYPGPGEPSSRAAMPLLSITTTKRAILLSRVLALFFASNSFSLCLSVHLVSFLIFFVFIRDPYATNFAVVLSSPLFVRAVRSLVCHLSVSSDYTVICIRANLAMVLSFRGLCPSPPLFLFIPSAHATYSSLPPA